MLTSRTEGSNGRGGSGGDNRESRRDRHVADWADPSRWREGLSTRTAKVLWGRHQRALAARSDPSHPLDPPHPLVAFVLEPDSPAGCRPVAAPVSESNGTA